MGSAFPKSLSRNASPNLKNNARYKGQMDFGNLTFNNQDLVVNNFNTGMNAAQQGAIAVAASTGSVLTAQ